MNTTARAEWQYTIHPEDIADAYYKGASSGKGCTIDSRVDDYGNFCFPESTLTYFLSCNPYTVMGSGKKLKSAWHNGFLSTVKRK